MRSSSSQCNPSTPAMSSSFDGMRYTVSRITLSSIELTRGDGAAITVTTAAMREKQLHSVTRSGKLQEELQFNVDRNKPDDKLKEVAHYVQQPAGLHPQVSAAVQRHFPALVVRVGRRQAAVSRL